MQPYFAIGFSSCMHERAGDKWRRGPFLMHVCVCVCKKQSLFNEQDVGQQGLSAELRDFGRERRRSVLLTRADLIHLPQTPHPKHQVEGNTHTHWCMYVSGPTIAFLSSHYCNNGFQKRLIEKPQSMAHSNSQIPTIMTSPGSGFNEQNGGQNTIKRHQSHKEVRYGCRKCSYNVKWT